MFSRFEWVLEGKQAGPNPACDVELLGNRDFAAIPSQGSILPGWLLAIPRKRAISIRELYAAERKQLLQFAQNAAAQIKTFSTKVYFLEHGPVRAGSDVGCGVDQAHMHVVPTTQDLLSAVLADPDVSWSAVENGDPWISIPPDVEYYLISDHTISYVGLPASPKSQFFRRKIAELTRTPDVWDYRKWPHYEHISRTIRHFADQSAGRAA